MKIKIYAKPRSAKNKIEMIGENEYKVWLKKTPVGGKANQELIALLSDFFRVSKSRISIKSGACAKIKIVEII